MINVNFRYLQIHNLLKMLFNKEICLLPLRMLSSMSESVPVITIPKYLKNRVKKLRAVQEHKRLEEIRAHSRLGNRSVPIITSQQMPELNHYLGRAYDRKKELPLISQGWRKGKYRGHSFIIHKHADNPCVMDPSIASFSSLGLKPHIVEVLHRNGYKTPSSIQEDAIPFILNRQNVACCAETGSGKTLAYMAPLLQMIQDAKQSKSRPPMSPLVLVLIPGKELALQISEVLSKLAEECKVNVCSLVPGINLQSNLNISRDLDEVDIVVSTAGTVNLLVKRGVFSISHVDHVVVDEADTLLDNSFVDELTDIMKNIIVQETGSVGVQKEAELPQEPFDFSSEYQLRNEGVFGAQLILVGATLPRRVEDTFGNLVDPGSLTWVRSQYLHRLPPHLTHKFMRMGKEEKAGNLMKLVKQEMSKNHPLIVFANTISSASWVSYYLESNNISNTCFHKEMKNHKRKESLDAFQNGKTNILCCTDLGSRGLDTTRAKHIVNFDFPRHMSDYIHRAGRTGRLSSISPGGQITNFICAKYEIPLLQQIEAAARRLKPLPNVDANIKMKYQEYGVMLEMTKSAQ